MPAAVAAAVPVAMPVAVPAAVPTSNGTPETRTSHAITPALNATHAQIEALNITSVALLRNTTSSEVAGTDGSGRTKLETAKRDFLSIFGGIGRPFGSLGDSGGHHFRHFSAPFFGPAGAILQPRGGIRGTTRKRLAFWSLRGVKK